MADDALGIALGELRPTQMTVGYREVATKRREWRAPSSSAVKLGRLLLSGSDVRDNAGERRGLVGSGPAT